MNLKKKKFIKIGAIMNIFLILMIFSLFKIEQLDRGTSKNDDIIITPRTSSITISKIEFSQAYGDTFDIKSRPYFKTGDGPFTINLYLDDKLDSNDNFQGEITSIDPYYHVRLYIDVEMIPIEELGLGATLTSLIESILGVVDHLDLVLKPESTNVVDFIIDSSNYDGYDALSGKHVYSYTLPCTEVYEYFPEVYVGELNVDWILDSAIGEWFLEIIAPVLDLRLKQEEYVQNIKFNVENKFKLEFSNGWYKEDIEYNGQKSSSVDFSIRNEDLTAPTYTEPSIVQESADSNFQISLGVQDEPHGSGLNEGKVYIYYKVNDGSYYTRSDPMLKIGNLFYGEILNQLAGSKIEYYITFEDYAGNTHRTDADRSKPGFQDYVFYANPLEIAPVGFLMIGLVVAVIAAISGTRIYRKRHDLRVITPPTKKKIDKYYRKINQEEEKI